jgi:hypothetical protein
MFKIYNVYSGRLHIDMVYAYDETHAIEITWKKFGDPRKYTITGERTYWAKEI